MIAASLAFAVRRRRRETAAAAAPALSLQSPFSLSSVLRYGGDLTGSTGARCNTIVAKCNHNRRERSDHQRVNVGVLATATLCFALLVATWVRARRITKARLTRRADPTSRRPHIGAAASPRALQRMIGLFPDCQTIAVVDQAQRVIGLIVVADVREALVEIANERAIVVADLMAPVR